MSGTSPDLEHRIRAVRAGVQQGIERLKNVQAGLYSEEDVVYYIAALVRDHAGDYLGTERRASEAKILADEIASELDRRVGEIELHGVDASVFAQVVLRFVRAEQAHAEDWFVATRELQEVRELAGAGEEDAASSLALSMLRSTASGDDRAEQRIIELLDHLGLDQAIVDGWDELVARRRRIHADGRLQYMHAVASWRRALKRIAEAKGSLAEAASSRVGAPLLPD